MPRKTRPSIEDVARLAGVSAQTVSRVSTGADPVRPATRERVLQAMAQLGYSPNHAARALRNGAFGTIGLVAQQFGRTGETFITQAVLDAAEREDYAITLMNVRDPIHDGWQPAAHRLSHQAIDGLIVIRAEHATMETLALPGGMPIAVSDSRLAGRYPTVASDAVRGTLDAVEHLVRLGHRTVHHISGPEGSEPGNIRTAAWRRCLQEAGLAVPDLLRGDWTPNSGYVHGQRIAADPSITAVFCANDEMAMGLIRALHEAGREIPGDISVVGFDDIALSSYSLPPLTTVRQNFALIGSELVRLVLAKMQSGAHLPGDRVLVPTELIVRASTAPPR